MGGQPCYNCGGMYDQGGIYYSNFYNVEIGKLK